MNAVSNTSGRVLVVEDEAPLRDAMVSFLKMDGLDAEGAASLQAAGQWRESNSFDVVILDLGLSDGDALDWLAANPVGNAGVIISTARSLPKERIQGMQSGADAYLVKPVQMEELSLLVQKLMKRVKSSRNSTWTLDKVNWKLHAPSGTQLKLTHSEAQIICLLVRAPGQAVSKNDLVLALGQQPATYDMRRLEILIRRLRNKARETFGVDLPLETAHRVGYAFTASVEIR